MVLRLSFEARSCLNDSADMYANLQVYGYARRFAKIGIAGALVDSLHGGLASTSLVSASIALKAVAVNVSLSRYEMSNC